jgi:glycosyltransferase involved in cell wall biosynthesis
VEEHFGRKPDVIVPPINMDEWPLGRGPSDGRPTVLAVGDFNVRRKGVRVLARAYSLMKQKVPDAKLQLLGRISPETVREITTGMPESVQSSIEFLGLGEPRDLSRFYQQASIMVLPAMWEPSGIAVMEALASGTPVVIARHGGLPEMINPGVGVQFDPKTNGEETHNVDGLLEALHSGLGLAADDGVRERCRRHAAGYSVEVMGPRYEEIYQGRQIQR